ncbi:MAG: Transcription termination/antitermination protein NusA [Deltaproteobacteria bacterium]|nr:Transcription termination/antitermination protein NusA [Deltaproteobacteria bacterium]
MYEIIKDFSKEKGLDHEVVKKLVEQSLIQAAQRKLPYREIEGQINEKTGNINLYHFKEVVDLVEDPNNEISVEDVFEIDPDAGIGDEVEYEISDREFQRIAHSTRPIIFGSLKEAERQMVVSTFTEKIGDVLTGTVLRVEPNGRVALSFQNKVEAYLFRREQIYGENFTFGDHVRVLLLDVNDNPHKDSQLTISRTHPGLLIKLFEMEVPEIYDGIVKIVSASREPGRRAKISVYSTDEEVDPVGSCVGMRGSRVQTIVNDLHGEKIDIVRWSEDIDVYTCNALAPAEIDSLEIDEEAQQIDVVVAPNQLSLAIGHKGQNVRLASKLIGYKINIVASEEEDLSIDEQLEKEFAKSKDNGEENAEVTENLSEDSNSESAEITAEIEQHDNILDASSETAEETVVEGEKEEPATLKEDLVAENIPAEETNEIIDADETSASDNETESNANNKTETETENETEVETETTGTA